MNARNPLYIKKTLFLCRLGLVAMLFVSLFFAGCASTNVPLAKDPPLYTQEKIQAVDHWDNIAVSVAERVKKTLEARPDLIAKPIYIKSPNDRPFTRAYHSLLQTELVSRGMQVSQKPEADGLVLEYDLQMVEFDSSRTGWVPTPAEMGISLVGAFGAGYSTPSKQEVIVNTHIAQNNRYVMHLSNYYYINDDDWAMYMNPGGSDPAADTSRAIHISNR